MKIFLLLFFFFYYVILEIFALDNGNKYKVLTITIKKENERQNHTMDEQTEQRSLAKTSIKRQAEDEGESFDDKFVKKLAANLIRQDLRNTLHVQKAVSNLGAKRSPMGSLLVNSDIPDQFIQQPVSTVGEKRSSRYEKLMLPTPQRAAKRRKTNNMSRFSNNTDGILNVLNSVRSMDNELVDKGISSLADPTGAYDEKANAMRKLLQPETDSKNQNDAKDKSFIVVLPDTEGGKPKEYLIKDSLSSSKQKKSTLNSTLHQDASRKDTKPIPPQGTHNLVTNQTKVKNAPSDQTPLTLADTNVPVPIDYHYQSHQNITAKPQNANASSSNSNHITSATTNSSSFQKTISSSPLNDTKQQQHREKNSTTVAPQILPQGEINHNNSSNSTVRKIDQQPSNLNSQLILKQSKERVMSYMKTLKNAKQQTHLLKPMDYVLDKKQMLFH
eukprot:TCONS_00067489-protein